MVGNNEKKKTIEELREELLRRELEKKLKDKGRIKQTRDIDTSVIGVCKTCHFPIHHGEAIYTPHDYTSDSSHSGEVMGGYSAVGKGGIGGGRYQGRNKRHNVSEGWIQCGFCYMEYTKDLDLASKYNQRLLIVGLATGFPTTLLSLGIGYWVSKEMCFYWLVGGLFISYWAVNLTYYLKYGPKPVINRYKLRVKERNKYETEKTLKPKGSIENPFVIESDTL